MRLGLVLILAVLLLTAAWYGRRAVVVRRGMRDRSDVPAPSGASSAPVSAATGASVVPDVVERTARTRSVFTSAFSALRSRGRLDDQVWEDLEEMLLRADIGASLAVSLLAPLRERVGAGDLRSVDEVIVALRESMTSALSATDRGLVMSGERPITWLFVGVNGVGKTTTIGKLAVQQVAAGRSVMLAAGDTFRAAAAEQLEVWAQRAGAAIVRGAEGGDPASVVFDAIQSGAARGVDLVLADTAGRLQNKVNLMDELAKVRRVADKAPGSVTEVLLVVDATTGQNGLAQARAFADATNLTGVVLTKLDGSAKGGIVFAIETSLGIPVKLVGLGEGPSDLAPFDPAAFIAALFD